VLKVPLNPNQSIFVPKMTYYISGGTLNLTRSLTLALFRFVVVERRRCQIRQAFS